MRSLLILPLAIAGCSAETPIPPVFNAQAKAEARLQRERVADARAVQSGFAPARPAPVETASIDPPAAASPGAMLPAATEQYRYIGRWARDAAGCGDQAWTFRSRRLDTPDGLRCDLPTIGVAPSGYGLQGQCKRPGGDRPATVGLTFDERRRTMTVSGVTARPQTLLYCGA